MINKKKRLEEANSLFFQKRFSEALFIYSQLYSSFPDNKEYKIYILLCDIAFEDIQKAMALYDYFSILKDENLQDAIKYMEDTIEAYDGNIEKMMSILKDINRQTVEDLNAIKYEEFKALIEKRGSFKVAFEDIMFSTKVAIEKKEDFYDFINRLIENGFNSTAYNYLEGFNEYFIYDKEIVKLYEKLQERQNDTRNRE
ncbi:hypothetical protein CRU87_07415 [Aliarcobacter trophiarum LMG 25534]|uniref:Histidine kinase n=1 Tax=Aliarcobacter trophiarum LMG 25534 TaxID=1032241 RepID=A0AAD0VMK2_9BACT|nr:hypothetical protein [Aliarcobacter trophiarum]AXK49324.1 hypothetical protein ATR_1477 [Aliarcobacter trophiarum LMG 25534]RXI27727.1 hypothetical protein CRU89_04610 [Aliarcobacter trophiarum]RXJ90109.1 hypothetical protein CRU87_07415 [Aliarcobacter trophiarum LMG 25534]